MIIKSKGGGKAERIIDNKDTKQRQIRVEKE